VAIDWESVGDDFWLFLPGQPTYGYDDGYYRFIRDRVAGSSEGPIEPDHSEHRAVIRAAIQAGLASEVRGVAIGDGPGPLGTPGAMGIAIDLPHSAVSLLSWAPITAAQPEDPRRGLTAPTTVGTDAGGVVWIGKLPHTGAVLRFDCDGTRYQIEARTGPSILLAVVDGLSAQLGCSPPGSAAPTECLGESYDPAACAEE